MSDTPPRFRPRPYPPPEFPPRRLPPFAAMPPAVFPVILGLSFLSYAVNFFLFASGRLAIGALPIVGASEVPTDPLPQALVLTAIVISFGMTAVIVLMALGAFFSGGHDRIDLDRPDRGEDRP